MNALVFRRMGFVVAVLLSGVGESAWGQVQYTLTDLGSLGGSASQPAGINALGQVVGASYTTGNNSADAFLYGGNGPMQDLNNLIAPNSGLNLSDATAINNLGQVVGYGVIGGGQEAFLYSGGSMQNLGTLPGGWNSYAYGINNLGQVVGWGYTSGNGDGAFLFSGGSMQYLGTLQGGSNSQAFGINNLGQIVGDSDNGTNYHAFLYSGGSMEDLGTMPGGTNSEAMAVNNLGQVVGYGNTSSSGQIAFLYSGGSMQSLGALPGRDASEADGINDQGQVVGYAYAYTNGSYDIHAFLYSGGIMQDLNNLIDPNLGWTLTNAVGINDNGQICGYGQYGGQQEAFLLTPVPEPSTLGLLGAAALAALGYAWRWRRAV